MIVTESTTDVSRYGFEEEYPFPSHILDLDGVRFHYVDEGQGETLLMVHGNPTWSFAWRNLIKDLSKNYRVLAVDHVGCGFSDKPLNYPYTLQQHVENLSRFVESKDLKNITLFAHDWGGAIGMGTAVRMPNRFSRFVLMNTAAFRSTQIPFRIAVCRIPLFGTIAIRGLNLFARSAFWMAVEHRERITPSVKAGYLAPYNNWKNRVAVLRFVQDIPMKASHRSYETLRSIEEGLERLRQTPMLLVWGMKDWCFHTSYLQEFQQRFTNTETFELPDAGHYLFEDAHERITPRVREFLESNPL
jgi:pimeloyl-ACP methyl ester carboxylesterase